MSSKFVVVRMDDSNDLYHEIFDDEDKARAYLEEDDNKAVLVKIENICDRLTDPTTVTVEDHT